MHSKRNLFGTIFVVSMEHMGAMTCNLRRGSEILRRTHRILQVTEVKTCHLFCKLPDDVPVSTMHAYASQFMLSLSHRRTA